MDSWSRPSADRHSRRTSAQPEVRDWPAFGSESDDDTRQWHFAERQMQTIIAALREARPDDYASLLNEQLRFTAACARDAESAAIHLMTRNAPPIHHHNRTLVRIQWPTRNSAQQTSEIAMTVAGLNPITRTFPEPARLSAQNTARI